MRFDSEKVTEVTDYRPRLPLYEHQKQAFLASRDMEAFAFLCGLGSGKSALGVHTAGWLFEKGEIDALVVIAPNGVHRQWIDQQVPEHLPERIPRIAAYWNASPRKMEKEAMDALWQPGDGLRVLTMNVEGLSTDKAKNYLRKFLDTFRTLLIVDESTRIAAPGAKRTKAILSLGKKAHYRRILTGQPIPNGPLNFYSQFKFLDPTILGFNTYSAFKHTYADFEERRTNNNRQGKFLKLTNYKNLNDLQQRIEPYSFRVRTEECVDLPEKIYETREVELGSEQKRVYKDLINEGVAALGEQASDPEDALMAMLMDEVPTVEVNNALTLLMRLQQVLGNWAVDSDGKMHRVEKTNRRLNALLETLQEVEGQSIVWARFRHELAEIEEALDKQGYTVVTYHGGVDSQTRQENVDQFQNGEAQIFLGQPAAGGIGLNLTAATTQIFYSSDFSLDTREQAEARCYRIGSEKPVTIVDLVAPGTVDKRIADALQSKAQTAKEVLDG
jgi:SNF2 family DNA or RNA helicase